MENTHLHLGGEGSRGKGGQTALQLGLIIRGQPEFIPFYLNLPLVKKKQI